MADGFETRAIHDGQPPDPARARWSRRSRCRPRSCTRRSGSTGLRVRAQRQPHAAARSRTCLASLEGALYGFAFASGMAAEDAVLRMLQPGDHVIIPDDAYGGTFRLVSKVLAPSGIEWTVADLTDLDALARDWPDGHRAGVGRDADQPHAGHRRHPRRVRDRTRARRAGRRRQHVRHAVPPAAARARRRHGRALRHQVPRRSLRRRRWVRGHQRPRDRGAHRLPAERGRRGAEPVRLLPRAARHQDARRAHGASLRERAGGGHAPARAPRGLAGALPRDRRCTPATPSRSGRCATSAGW